MAKKKYICTGCHKCTEPCTVELSGDADMTKDPNKMLHCGTWLEVPAKEDTNKEQLPKLTVDVFSMEECPEWAQYAAVDADGAAYWYAAKPDLGSQAWCNISKPFVARRITLANMSIRYDKSNWRNSLIERPAAQRTKLTREVFSMEECPEWAQYAAVDAGGLAYWYEDKPERLIVEWRNTERARRIGQVYDATDWQNSLVERRRKLTAEIFNHPECPADAVVAVVNASGTAAWGNRADIVCDGDGAFLAAQSGSNTWTPIPGGACFDATDWEHSAVYRDIVDNTTEIETRKLTHDVFSCSTLNEWTYVIRSQVEYGKTYARCPEWARYAAVDQSGAVCVYDTKPVLRSTDWYPDSGGRCAVVCNAGKWVLRFDTTDWKNSLIERPESECMPKLTPDVFSLAECPEWARYAAVDHNGLAYWYDAVPYRSALRWENSGNHAMKICYAGEVAVPLFDATDWEHSLIVSPTAAPRPKLTVDVFSSPQCPDWAKYAAVDADGVAWYYGHKPIIGKCRWGTPGHTEVHAIYDSCKYARFDATDWEHSLIERPSVVPKLTHEVFSMEGCPEWARYAAVDETGFAFWYEKQPRLSTLRCWLSTDLHSKKINHPGSNVSIVFDGTDWAYSLIERPTAAPKLTTDVFSMKACPDWARYAAVDANGFGYWYAEKPEFMCNHRGWIGASERNTAVPITREGTRVLYDATDWEHSLIERPAAAPKLTHDVFSMEECPKWARFTAVDADGVAYWYEVPPRLCTEAHCWEIVGLRGKRLCHPGSSMSILFDADDWKNSLIERPAAVPDWFKPGALAYNNNTRTCFHVTYSTEYRENYLEAKVRPFSDDELERKLGQFVLGPNGSKLLVTGYCAEGRLSGKPEICVLGDKWLTAEDLLTFGSRPQGIKQYHSKEGTWIDCGLSS